MRCGPIGREVSGGLKPRFGLVGAGGRSTREAKAMRRFRHRNELASVGTGLLVFSTFPKHKIERLEISSCRFGRTDRSDWENHGDVSAKRPIRVA